MIAFSDFLRLKTEERVLEGKILLKNKSTAGDDQVPSHLI